MGIQLSDHDREILGKLAEYRAKGDSIYPYLYGYLQSSVDLFLSGLNETRDLEYSYASAKLLEELACSLTVEHLREVASGTREVPGEDVPSGQ